MPMSTTSLAAALAACCCFWSIPSALAAPGASGRDLPSAGLQTPYGDGGWLLVDQAGRQMRDQSFHGRFRLMMFGYTSCPDVCPTALSELAEVMDRLGDLGRFVVPVFVTVDPQRDTRVVLAGYVGHFDPRIVALTGTEAQLRSLRRAYGALAVPGPVSADGDYVISHSAARYLIGPSGERIQDFADDDSPDVIVAYLARLFRRIGERPAPAGQPG